MLIALKKIALIPLLLIYSSSSFSLTVDKGEYQFCTPILRLNGELILMFNFKTRQQLRIALTGDNVDKLFKSKLDTGIVKILIKKDIIHSDNSTARLLTFKKCEMSDLPLLKISNNFKKAN